MLIALALAAVQEATPTQPAEESGTAGIYHVLAEQIEMRDLLEYWARKLDLNLEVAQSDLGDPVSIRTGPGMSVDGFWALTNRLLADRGFACVQVPGEENFTVVPLDRAAQSARIEQDVANARAGYVRVMVEIDRAGANDVSDALGAVLEGQGGQVSILPDSGRAILSGLTPQVRQALDLIAAIDEPSSPPTVEELRLRHIHAIGFVALAERILAAEKKVGEPLLTGTALALPEGDSVLIVAPESELEAWRGLAERFDRPERSYSVTYVPRRFGIGETQRLIEEVIDAERAPESDAPPRIVADELTGSLVIRATPSQHARVEDLLERLDAADVEPRRSLRSIGVRNRDASELLQVLHELIGEGSGALADQQGLGAELPASERPAEAGTSGRAADYVPSLPLDELTITADIGTNRLLAVGQTRWLDELEGLVATLDVQHPQVLVETLVVTLSDSETQDVSVELQKLITSGDTQTLLFTLFGTQPEAAPLQALPAPSGTGFGGVVLDPGSFQGVLRALQTVNDGRALTMPKALVANNQTATLNAVLQTPYLSTNASQTVATTSLGGTQDAGTSLTLRPQIAEADRLILDYEVSVSVFTAPPSDPALPPPRQENSLQSVVTIPDGYTVALGGLEVTVDSDVTSKVPLIGDIPILGFFFRGTSTVKTKERFFVFLRCTVLRDERFEDLRYVSDAIARDWEIDRDVPRLMPRVIR